MPKDEEEHPFMLSGCKLMDGFGDMMVCFLSKLPRCFVLVQKSCDVPFDWINSREIMVLALEMLATKKILVFLVQFYVILLKLTDEHLRNLCNMSQEVSNTSPKDFFFNDMLVFEIVWKRTI
jgi:hypothetical protein